MITRRSERRIARQLQKGFGVYNLILWMKEKNIRCTPLEFSEICKKYTEGKENDKSNICRHSTRRT